MCRRSCCQPRHHAPGTAAAALVIAAIIVAARIGPDAGEIAREVIIIARLAALSAAALAAAVVAVWAVTRLARWQLGRRRARHDQTGQVIHGRWLYLRPVRGGRLCPACGGNGEVLRADGSGRFVPRACPECDPARLAG